VRIVRKIRKEGSICRKRESCLMRRQVTSLVIASGHKEYLRISEVDKTNPC